MKKKKAIKEKKKVMAKKDKKERPKMLYIPPILISRYRKFVLFSVLTFIFGIIATFMKIGLWYITLTMFTLVAAGIFVVACIYKHNITYKGYFMIEGEVVYEVKGIGISLKNEKRPTAYRIKDSDGIVFQIPVQKKSLTVPIGTQIRLYAPVDVYIYESEGIYKISNVWCYELVPTAEETSAQPQTPQN